MRANLLQPLTSLETLRMRQDAVQELVGNDDLAFTVGQGLSQMPKDLDRWVVLVSNLACRTLMAIPGQVMMFILETGCKGLELLNSKDPDTEPLQGSRSGWVCQVIRQAGLCTEAQQCLQAARQHCK